MSKISEARGSALVWRFACEILRMRYKIFFVLLYFFDILRYNDLIEKIKIKGRT